MGIDRLRNDAWLVKDTTPVINGEFVHYER